MLSLFFAAFAAFICGWFTGSYREWSKHEEFKKCSCDSCFTQRVLDGDWRKQ